MDVSVASTTDIGVISVYNEQPNASNQDDTLNNQEVKKDAVTVSSISLKKKDDVDVSVAITTDTGVISVYSEQPHASNQDYTLNNQEVKEDAVTVSSISLEKKEHISKIRKVEALNTGTAQLKHLPDNEEGNHTEDDRMIKKEMQLLRLLLRSASNQ